MTKLDAVNNMLLGINEQPVSVLDDNLQEVKIALMILNSTLDLVLNEGWHFNREDGIELPPSSQGIIYLPNNALHVDPTDDLLDYTVRDGKLYNRKLHTFTFDGPVKVDIIYRLPFDELPVYAQTYITEKATRRFIAKTFGDQVLYQYQSQEEIEAYTQMVSAEVDSQDANMLDSYKQEFYRY